MKKIKKEKTAFTLVETIIALTVLGIIAVIVVPPVLKKHQEAIARTKIKKAMTIYDGLIARMLVENDIKTKERLVSWSKEKADCENTVAYFKFQDRDGCKFKTSDGVYWDITDIMNPVVAVSKKDYDNYKKDPSKNAKIFNFATMFDPELGTFRINDVAYALAHAPEEIIEELQKLYGFLKGDPLEDTPVASVWDKYSSGKYNTPCQDGVYVACTREYTAPSGAVAVMVYDDNGTNIILKEYGYGDYNKEHLRSDIKYDPSSPDPNNPRVLSQKQYDNNGNLAVEELYTGYTADGKPIGTINFYWVNNPQGNNPYYTTSNYTSYPNVPQLTFSPESSGYMYGNPVASVTYNADGSYKYNSYNAFSSVGTYYEWNSTDPTSGKYYNSDKTLIAENTMPDGYNVTKHTIYETNYTNDYDKVAYEFDMARYTNNYSYESYGSSIYNQILSATYGPNENSNWGNTGTAGHTPDRTLYYNGNKVAREDGYEEAGSLGYMENQSYYSQYNNDNGTKVINYYNDSSRDITNAKASVVLKPNGDYTKYYSHYAVMSDGSIAPSTGDVKEVYENNNGPNYYKYKEVNQNGQTWDWVQCSSWRCEND